MTHLWVKRFAFVLFFIISISACGQAAATPATSPTAATAADTSAGPSYPEEITVQQNLTYGPGPFVYTDTRAGLSDLPGYQSVLIITFDGTRDGQPEKWSKTYTMLATKDPQARQLMIERTRAASKLDPALLAEMDGMSYERQGENTCNATALQEGNSLGERLEPALFLSPLIGADEAGSEMVNGVQANHYTFDQHALGEQDLTESTGEIWVASEGNYIVKYLLTRKGKADYFGEGIEGSLTLDYELADPTQPVTIALPEDCPPGMVDAPLLQDASNVEKAPGVLSYETTAPLKDVAAFYQEQLPSLGWKAEGQPSIDDATAFLDYKKGSQTITVIIDTTDSGTAVQILLENSQQ